MKAYIKQFLLIFAVLGIILIPASSTIFVFQNGFTPFLFGGLVETMGVKTNSFSSDSEALYLLVEFLAILALLSVLILSRIRFWKDNHPKITHIVSLVLVYYLASRLFVYGFDKIFKTQFYLPEPNTLYTPFGRMTKDILFWSVMGTSKLYCILTGLFELIPAVLLLFKKTRVLGLILTFLVLINVLAINFGFDISVKLYSLFLLFITGVLLLPQFKALFNFFTGEQAQLHPSPQESTIFKKPYIRISLKVFVIGLIAIESLYFAFLTNNFNDDTQERPFLHGAYQVDWIGEGPFFEMDGERPSIKRFFIHRRGFLIFQFTDDSSIDFKVEINQAKSEMTLVDYDGKVNILQFYLYQDGETNLELMNYSVIDGKLPWIKSHKIDWQDLPALQDEFHWTIDSYE